MQSSEVFSEELEPPLSFESTVDTILTLINERIEVLFVFASLLGCHQEASS
jgi:hypothetical protein